MKDLDFNLTAFVKPTNEAEFQALLREAHSAAEDLLDSLRADTAYLTAMTGMMQAPPESKG